MSGNVVPSTTAAEHIGPAATGDNIEAKRVANYGWDGTSWQRQSPTMGRLVTEKFDYIGVEQTNATTETYIYKTGGSGGTTVATVVVVYTDSAKADLSSVTRS